ncbi:MAG TPA: HU family DNA-binding protein [Spirochaetota bacterium]|nr:HU family DNA-binding protein [Spirochaetota bacterium]OPZ38503.1 MAG: DNA-binding protein HU [Spirochaetes bacterium ADurb.BinA120]HNU91031.1 HU family DNA-binding protein [Spirochaetota bacterium]HPI15892.1 HU family DNA-binding protein [Spirochaetota bacterium]HPO47086.1 HU family DNA-binding protein [Spirochaetota bacterium]
MTKHEIIDQLTLRSGLKRREVGYIVDNFLELILKNLDTESRIDIRGFGTFTRVLRKERRVYSPIAGRSLDVPARSVLSFKPSKSTEKEV